MVIGKKVTAAIGTIGCISLALLGLTTAPAKATAESRPASAGPVNPHYSSAREKVEVTTNPRAAEVTSSDKVGRVGATITLPGQATSPEILPVGPLATAGDRVNGGGRKELTTATPDTVIQTTALEDGMQTIIVFDNARAARDVTFKLEVTPSLIPVARTSGAIDFVDGTGAVVAAIPGVGPTVGGIAGGCVVGALNAMWDGADFWGGFWGCATGAALGAVAGMVGSIVKNVLGSRGIGV